MKCITTWKIKWKVSLRGSNFFESLNNLFFMYNVSNQNGKVLEETLAGSNSDTVKTTMRGGLYFKTNFPLFQVLQKPFPIPLPLCHI